MSTTRQGKVYKRGVELNTEEAGEAEDRGSEMAKDTGGDRVADLLQMLIEDRQRRDDEAAARERERAEEQRRREQEHELRVRQMEGQIEAMRSLLDRRVSDRSGGEVRDQLKLTKLTESEDIEAYLKTFERMMEAYEVQKDRWAFKLAPQLTGKAQQAYASLNGDDAAKYDEVKKAILRRYDINEETYRRRFRGAKPKEGESFVELAVRLEDLVKKWLDGCKTLEEVREKLVVEQMLNVLPTEIRVWVGERKPETGNKAGELAEDYLQARRRGGAGARMNIMEGRKSEKNKGEARKCHACGKEGHLARNCSKPSSGGESQESMRKENKKSGKMCYNCKKRGHIAMHCPDKALFCEEGPIGSLTRQGKVEDQEVKDILLDTGCSRTMVQQSLVKEESYLEGEAVTVLCAHGDVALYPLAEVRVEVGGINIKVRAAVAERLPVSVLLGTDVTELSQLLGADPRAVHTQGMEEAFVTTRAQERRQEKSRQEEAVREEESGIQPTAVEELGRNTEEESGTETRKERETDTEELPGSTFSDDLFESRPQRGPRLSRRMRRKERHQHGLERAKDQRKKATLSSINQDLDVSREELKQMQETDETLEGGAISGRREFSTGSGYQQDGTGTATLTRLYCQRNAGDLFYILHTLFQLQVTWDGRRRWRGSWIDSTGQRCTRM